MLKKIGIPLVIIAFLYFLMTQFAPTMADKAFNTVTLAAPYEIPENVKEKYNDLPFVSDLHCDVLLWKRDISKKNDFGQVDIPRMIAANVALQAFTIVSKTPHNLNFDKNDDTTDDVTKIMIAQGRSPATWFSLKNRAIDQSERLQEFADESDGTFRVIRSSEDLKNYITDREHNKQITAGYLGIEGAQVLEGKVENVQAMYDVGVRMIGLTHFFDNKLGGSAHGVHKGGLTEFGRAAVKKMEELNIMVDLSHASPKLVDDLLDMATRPLIVSHTGVKGTCDNIRNLSDNHLKRIAAGRGLVGIAMFKKAVCGTDATATAKAIKYTADLIGVKHVALGSDFDGAVNAHFDITGLPLIAEELTKLGLSESDISLIMGGNVKRFLLENLPKS